MKGFVLWIFYNSDLIEEDKLNFQELRGSVLWICYYSDLIQEDSLNFHELRDRTYEFDFTQI